MLALEEYYWQIMKKILGIFLVLMVFSCTDFVPKPQHLLTEEEMAEVVMELGLNENIARYDTHPNTEARTEAVFKKLNVRPQDFTESMTYYTATGNLQDIYQDAAEFLKEKYPEEVAKAEEFQKKNEFNLPTSQ